MTLDFTAILTDVSHADSFGQGVGGAVPEPATWTLLTAGFGGLGALLRRKRRLALAAA